LFQSIFERFDKDRSGKIDSIELRDALLSLGYAVSPVVLDLLVSKFDKTGGKSKAIEYDNFIEYGFSTIVFLLWIKINLFREKGDLPHLKKVRVKQIVLVFRRKLTINTPVHCDLLCTCQ